MAEHGCNKVMIQTVDTDIVVIAISLFHELPLSELWIEFGTGIHKRWLTIHQYSNSLAR